MDEDSLFAAALERPTEAARRDFLDEACAGDAPLRQRLERLLAYDAQARGVLERGPDPATVLAACRPAPALRAEEFFAGRFRLRHKLGTGGMGEVWVADQIEPVQRKVALKVIRPGLDSSRLLPRFEQERQALALMDHPNVARVLDAGVADGRPYFVMELIQGVPITTACDEARLAIRQRLGLFVQVCQAVQHAHQKGIIHRDLKPSNILVTRHDGRPVPKVIDFGVAKVTGPRLGAHGVSTEVGTLVGTLEYMSPEQAELNDQDVDTRGDVYSLGVLLYELLTGTLPFSREQLQAVSFTEMLRMIKVVEPPRPSTRLIAADKKLPALLRGELDWVVMKCLEKDPARRYQTANGLAEDIERHLADEPVRARPPGVGYRLRKFVTRHRGPVLAATGVLLALVAGIVGTTWGLVQAKEEEGQAKGARDEAQRQAKKEMAARNRAEWLLYASRINLAQQAWESHNPFLAFHHLESCDPDYRGWEHDYLFTLFTSNQHTFRGHAGEALIQDGKRIVSAYADGTMKVWDAVTGQELASLQGYPRPTNRSPYRSGLAMSSAGTCIVSGHSGDNGEKTIKVWDAATGKETLTLDGQPLGVNILAISPDGTRIVSAGRDDGLRVWDAATGKEAVTLQGPPHGLDRAAFSSDGTRVVSGGNNKTVKVWDAATGRETLTLKGYTSVVGSLAFSPDGLWIACGGLEKTVKVWDAATGGEARTFKGHTDMINSVAFSSDSKRIVSGSNDGTVRVWDVAADRETLILLGHRDNVTSVAFTSDGKRIVSGGQDQTIKVWDATVSQGPRTLKASESAVACVAMSPDGQHIVSGHEDDKVRVWDLATGNKPITINGHTHFVTFTAFSPNGERIISAACDRTVRVWDAASGQRLQILKDRLSSPPSVAVSPDGQRIVTNTGDEKVKVWDAATAREILTLKGHPYYVISLAFSPDGNRIIGGTHDGTIKVWDSFTGEELFILKGHLQAVASVALSPDGQRIVGGSWDKTIKVWDLVTGEELLTLKGHTNCVTSVALSPDGKRIVSGSWDKTIKVWDTATGQETLTLGGHSDGVTSVVFSPDGKRIVSGSKDGTLKVWDASLSQPKP